MGNHRAFPSGSAKRRRERRNYPAPSRNSGKKWKSAFTIPSLTSIEGPTLEMVRFAFATLVEVVEGTRAPDDLAQRQFPTRLVVRDSTGSTGRAQL